MKEKTQRAAEELYRDKWKWDKVVVGTHCVDCYPGNCPYRVYVKDGVVFAEEQCCSCPRGNHGWRIRSRPSQDNRLPECDLRYWC